MGRLNQRVSSKRNFVRVSRGMGLIETVIGVAIMLAVFLSLFAGFRLAIELVYNTKAKTGAVALITEQMESVRGRTYDAVGTVGGIPAGDIPQIQQKTLNNIAYTIRTLIQYVDAPEDGLGAADTNAVTADHKSIKVEVTWAVHGKSRSTFAVTRVSPHGVESLLNGGTLRVNTFNALATPVPGATVRIQNQASTPTVDVSAATDSTGAVIFPGTPVAPGYHITVTKSGYSSSTTYAPTVANPNPNPGDVAVADKQTTTVSFGIDLLGSLRVLTFEPLGPGAFDDTFVDESYLSATSSVVISNDALELLSDGSTFASEGFARSVPISPPYLVSWGELTLDTATPQDTSIVVRVYYLDGSAYVLVPDDALAGNSAGFSGGIIDVSTLPTATYTSLKIEATLSTTDPAVTARLSEWALSYSAGPTPLPNVAFDIHGAKTIGTSGSGVPIAKYSGTYSTSLDGEKVLSSLEWDTYTLSVPSSYGISERCPFGISIAPGEQKMVSLTLDDPTTNSLLMYVASGGSPVPTATVSVSGPLPVQSQKTTSACGQVYFDSLSAGTYTITVSAPSYAPYSEDVSVAGAAEFTANLTPQ